MLFSRTSTLRLVEAFTHSPPQQTESAPDLAALTDREIQALAAELKASEATVNPLNRVMSKLPISSRAQAAAITDESSLVRPRGLTPLLL